MTITYLIAVLINLIAAPWASWRLANLVIHEEGPFNILVKFRSFLGVSEDIDERAGEERFWSKLLSCIYCTSVWTGTAVFLLAITGVGGLIIMPLAISTKTIEIHKRLDD